MSNVRDREGKQSGERFRGYVQRQSQDGTTSTSYVPVLLHDKTGEISVLTACFLLLKLNTEEPVTASCGTAALHIEEYLLYTLETIIS